MSDLSNYGENACAKYIANETPPTLTTLYLSLHTGSPGEANDGSNELAVANGYAREAISFASVSGASVSTDTDIVFTASGGDWSGATHYGIYDASTAGNLVALKAIGSTVTVTDGNTFTVGSGDLSITFA